MFQVSETRAWPIQDELGLTAANYAFDLETGTFDTNDLIPDAPPGGCEETIVV